MPPVHYDSFDGAVTHPSDSSHGVRTFAQTTNQNGNLYSNMTSIGRPSSEKKATQINFNTMPRPWKKEIEKCTSNKISRKGPCDRKTVRFNIAPFHDRQNTYKEQTSSLLNSYSKPDTKKSPKKDGVIAKNPGNLDFVQKGKLHESHSYFTSFSLSSSQVKNPLTAFESDTGPKVAKIVPVTSTNNLENSHSVTETTDVEHVQMPPDGVDWTYATTLESAINTEERHAEVLDNHVASVPSEPQFRIATQTSGVAESQLLTDHFVASSFTVDYNTDSVASSGSHPDEYKVNMGKRLAQEKTEYH